MAHQQWRREKQHSASANFVRGAYDLLIEFSKLAVSSHAGALTSSDLSDEQLRLLDLFGDVAQQGSLLALDGPTGISVEVHRLMDAVINIQAHINEVQRHTFRDDEVVYLPRTAVTEILALTEIIDQAVEVVRRSMN